MNSNPFQSPGKLILPSIISADHAKLGAAIDDMLKHFGGASLEFLENGHFSTIDILD